MTFRSTLRCLLATFVLAAGLAPPARAASSVMIWPVDPLIEDGQRAAALWLENRGNEPVSLQIRVLDWRQTGTEEHYGDQDRIIASPPLAVVPPGQRQLVRLMNTAPVPDGKEVPYRILVDELPEAEGATPSPRDGSNAIGVKLQIRYSLPLFVHGKGVWTRPVPGRQRDPATASRPELRWRTVHEGGAHYLTVRNTGTAHARLTSVRWSGVAPVSINPGLLGYVLAGSEMRWRLAAPPPAGAHPEAKVNGSQDAQPLAPLGTP